MEIKSEIELNVLDLFSLQNQAHFEMRGEGASVDNGLYLKSLTSNDYKKHETRRVSLKSNTKAIENIFRIYYVCFLFFLCLTQIMNILALNCAE